MRSVWGIGIAATLVLGVAPAQAATVRAKSGFVILTAAPGEANDITVTGADGGLTISDAGVPLLTGHGCAATAPGTVTCAGARALIARLGDGDDRITAGPEADDIAGGAGDDVIDAGPGKDTVREGGDPGAHDVIDGGSEQDELTYAGTDTPVRVDLAAGRGGAGGRDDDLAGIEDVTGSDSDDVLLGDAGRNWLIGTAYGTGRDATPPHGDRLDGRAGRDHLVGSGGDDRLAGGEGEDSLSGAGGHDLVLGGPGNDVVQPGVDVPPRVRCGTGRDLVDLYGGAMTLAADCEVLSSLHGTAELRVRGNRLVLTFPHLSCVSLRLGRSGPVVEVPSRRGGRGVLLLPAGRRGSIAVWGRVDCRSAADHSFTPYFRIAPG